jgi:hypothetical protein
MSQGAPGRKDSIKEVDEEDDFGRAGEYGTQLRSKEQKKKVEITSGEKSMMSKSFKGGFVAKKVDKSSTLTKNAVIPIGAKFSGNNVVLEATKRVSG